MACTWDAELVERVARATAVEVAATGHPLDVLAGAVHHPGPALGPGGRDVRRGSVPDRRAGRGDGARLPGRRAGTTRPPSWRAPSTSPATPRPRAAGTPARPTSARASCGPGSCRRSSERPVRAAGRSCSGTRRWTACRSPPTGGCSTTSSRGSGASPGRWSPTGTTSAGWSGSRRSAPTIVEAAAVAVRAGNDLVMTTPQFFDGAQDAVAQGRLGGVRDRRGRPPDPAAEVRAGPVRGSRGRRGPGPAGRGDRQRRSTRRSTSRWPGARLVLLRNDGTLPLDGGLTAGPDGRALASGSPDDRGHRSERRRSGRRMLGDWAGDSGQIDWMPDGHPREMVADRARRLPRRRPRRAGTSPTPGAPTSRCSCPIRPARRAHDGRPRGPVFSPAPRSTRRCSREAVAAARGRGLRGRRASATRSP